MSRLSRLLLGFLLAASCAINVNEGVVERVASQCRVAAARRISSVSKRGKAWKRPSRATDGRRAERRKWRSIARPPVRVAP